MPRLTSYAALAVAAVLTCAPAARALTINPTFDPSITALTNAAQVEAAFNSAAAALTNVLGSGAVINVQVGWGEVGGTTMPTGALGSSQSPLYGYFSYAQMQQWLAPTGAVLPAVTPAPQNSFVLAAAQAKGLGLVPANTSMDGAVGFKIAKYTYAPGVIATGTYDFTAIALHELSEVLGRFSGIGQGFATSFDLFRYSAPNQPLYAKTLGYFSTDGGNTNQGTLNTAVDFGDWKVVTGIADAQDATTGTGKSLSLSSSDIVALQLLGYGSSATAPPFTQIGVAMNVSSAVPEPTSLALLGAGLVAFGISKGRRPRGQAQA